MKAVTSTGSFSEAGEWTRGFMLGDGMGEVVAGAGIEKLIL